MTRAHFIFRPLSAGFLFGLILDPEHGGNIPPKRRAVLELHGIATQETLHFIVTTVRTSNSFSNPDLDIIVIQY
jgi:hypothetical protein